MNQRRWVLFAILSFGSVYTVHSPYAQIPSARRITWEGNVGIPNGIPNRTAIYQTINASTYGNGANDASSGIQTALNNCLADQVVLLSAGTFRINSSLKVPSNVTLRGAGPSQTILDAHGAVTSVVSFGQGTSPYTANSTAITGGTAAGSSVITVSSANGISVGSYLMITQLNDTFVTIVGGEGSCTWCDGGIGWNGTRAMGQIVEVTSVNGTSIGIAPSLYINYSPSLSPLASRFSAGAKYAGVEDLQVYANNTGYTTNFMMEGAAYCWIKNVESNFADGDHVRAFWAYRCEIRDSYFHDAYSHTPGQTDADVFIADKSSGILIENNILRRLHAEIMLNWGAAGNVIGYNFCEGSFDQNATNVLMGGLSMHGSHPMFNLWEGNVASSLYPDGVWGSSSHNTAFRNWFKGTTKIYPPLIGRGTEKPDSGWWACQANRAVQISFGCRYYNFAGNIVGSPELLAVTSYNNGRTILPMVPLIVAPQNRVYDSKTYGYTFGYSELSDDGSGSYPEDNQRPYTTAIIHGDYNYADGKTRWDSTILDHNLPASLYRSAKPLWFGAVAWPPLGPDVSGLTNKIPAQIRFEDGAGILSPGQFNISSGSLMIFKPATSMLVFHIAEPGLVKLEMYDVSGRLLKKLICAKLVSGNHSISISKDRNLADKTAVFRLTTGAGNSSLRAVVKP